MTSEGLGEMFGGDFSDMCTNKYPLKLMGVAGVLHALCFI
jgi:hypothetical protein